MSTKARIVLTQVREAQGTSLRISALELNRILLKFLLLCYVDVQVNSLEDNAKFNFLGIIRGTVKCCLPHDLIIAKLHDLIIANLWFR